MTLHMHTLRPQTFYGAEALLPKALSTSWGYRTLKEGHPNRFGIQLSLEHGSPFRAQG